MLANLLRRFATREAALSTAAQLALTWGANHLSGVIAAQAEQLDALTAELEATRNKLDAALEVLNEHQADEQADALAYPTAQDTDPLERAHADLTTALNTPEG